MAAACERNISYYQAEHVVFGEDTTRGMARLFTEKRSRAPILLPERREASMAQAHRLSDTILQDIVQRIVDVAQPERIILFGSAARGEMGPHSDVDVLVV
jgi:predicted nucleotidyltransferase